MKQLSTTGGEIIRPKMKKRVRTVTYSPLQVQTMSKSEIIDKIHNERAKTNTLKARSMMVAIEQNKLDNRAMKDMRKAHSKAMRLMSKPRITPEAQAKAESNLTRQISSISGRRAEQNANLKKDLVALTHKYTMIKREVIKLEDIVKRKMRKR